ncbi:integrase [Herbaspirillum rubrisubalbicans Os34]|uniref:Integrase n=1 Tax=Herbaspirillum rubrisubalbicans Os34 TaxID=1235827 RepID=A0A6M3ZWQ4_9BURK|nr:site-specific integrase [Herbaspirillum rubrisubalbicans]QJQ02330.1 integrase [Herbaspirillum rubrisubalbicans Os34]
MIGRKQVVRKVESIVLDGTIVDLPPSWCFTIRCQHHGEIRFDFTPWIRCSRDDLVMQIRDAVWSLRHELVGITLQGIFQQIATYFWPFLDDLEKSGRIVNQLIQIDERVVRDFLAWLERRIAAGGRRSGQPLSLSAKKNAYTALKSVLTNRMKRTPDAVSSELKFPKSPFPNINRLIPKRLSYSQAEQNRILAACNQDLKRIHSHISEESLSPAQVLAVHLIILALATGKNFQGLLELRRDSLKPHPLKDREVLITEKRRGGSTHVTSYRAQDVKQQSEQGQILTIPTTVGNYFRWLADFTNALRDEARTEDRDLVFLWLVPHTGRHPRSTRQGRVNRFTQVDARNAIADFIVRHGLVDDRGERLLFSVARCRPTFGTNLYARTRDIRKVQLAMGHASAETTARHYVALPAVAERDHVFVGQAMVGAITSAGEKAVAALAADGKIPLQNVRELLRGGYNTVVARCKNPFREGGDVCGKYMVCFRCPQMVVFEDDLWKMFSFYNKLLAERNKIAPHHWVKTYGWVIKTIDNDIATQFPADLVEAARNKARMTPHPAWVITGITI